MGDISATAYIMQRFAGGEDNESLENLANLGTTKQSENEKVKKMLYKEGGLVECETFYNDKGVLEYQKKSLAKYVDVKLEDKAGDDTVTDASGNVLAVTRQKAMDPKEIKKAIKDCEKKLKDHKKKPMSDEDLWAVEDKLNALKEQLKA